MNNPFLNRLVKDKIEDVVHSSTYAKAQNSNGLGATSSQSFTDRMKIEHNRKRIRGYNDARVVTEAFTSSGIKAEAFTSTESKETTPQSDSKTPSQTTPQNSLKNFNPTAQNSFINPNIAPRNDLKTTSSTPQNSLRTPSPAPQSNHPMSHPPARKNPGIMR